MSVNENIENSNESNFPNIKIIILGVLLATSIIGGLCYYFATNKKPSEQPVQEVIEDNQETENNNEENIEKQPEIIISNEYIPVIDCLWLNILVFVIVTIALLAILGKIGKKIRGELRKKGFEHLGNFFSMSTCEKSKLALAQFAIGLTIMHQIVFYAIWFILVLIFAAFSKIWDKEHSWWSNVKKGFLRNRIHRGWWSLIPILLAFLPTLISIISLIENTFFLKKNAEDIEVEPIQ